MRGLIARTATIHLVLKCDVSGYAVSANPILQVCHCSNHCTGNYFLSMLNPTPGSWNDPFRPGGWMTRACVHTLHQPGQRRASRSCPRTSKAPGEHVMPSACREPERGQEWVHSGRERENRVACIGGQRSSGEGCHDVVASSHTHMLCFLHVPLNRAMQWCLRRFCFNAYTIPTTTSALS